MITVHNLTVTDYHTYAVGNAEALVHNKAMHAPEYKITSPGLSNAAKKNDIPTWAEEARPYKGENGSTFAERLLNEKYGEGKWKKGPTSEYNRIKKWGDSAFQDP